MRSRIIALSIIAAVSLYFARGYCDQAIRGRVDLFTHKGGRGLAVPSPPYELSEEVFLYANVTYRGYPQQNSGVLFEIINPQGRIFIFTGKTNASGIAATRFVPPSEALPDEIFGIWSVLATARVESVQSDVLEFLVRWNHADTNGDHKVDMRDLAIIATAFDSQPGDSNWNPKADLTGPCNFVPDGKVDEKDIEAAAENYGKTYP